MARTQQTGLQLLDESVGRVDLNSTTAGSAVIKKILAGLGLSLTNTGIDAGTGDVTLNLKTGAVFGAATRTDNLVATTETVIASWAIPANRLVAGDNLDLSFSGQVNSTAAMTFRIHFGTAGTPADALVAVFTGTGAGSAGAYLFANALVSVLTATTMTANGMINFVSGFIYPVATGTFAAATVNLAVANILTVTLVQGAVQTYTSRAAKLSV